MQAIEARQVLSISPEYFQLTGSEALWLTTEVESFLGRAAPKNRKSGCSAEFSSCYPVTG